MARNTVCSYSKGYGARRMADGGKVRDYGAGGKVKGRRGPIDNVSAKITPGEYVLPVDTTRAIGVKRLDAVRAATHKPVKMADGGLVDDDSEPLAQKMINYGKNFQMPGAGYGVYAREKIGEAYDKGGLPAAIGQTLHTAPGAIIASAADIYNMGQNLAEPIIRPAAQVLKTTVTGDPTPIGQEKPAVATPATAAPVAAQKAAPSAPAAPAAPAPNAPATTVQTPSSPVQLTNEPLVAGDNGPMRFGAGDVAAINAGIRSRGGSNSFTNVPGAAGTQVPSSSGYVPDQGNVDRLNRMTANYLAERNQPAAGTANGPQLDTSGGFGALIRSGLEFKANRLNRETGIRQQMADTGQQELGIRAGELGVRRDLAKSQMANMESETGARDVGIRAQEMQMGRQGRLDSINEQLAAYVANPQSDPTGEKRAALMQQRQIFGQGEQTGDKIEKIMNPETGAEELVAIPQGAGTQYYRKLKEQSEAAPAVPVAIKTAQELAALPSGTRYTAPDGSIRTKR